MFVRVTRQLVEATKMHLQNVFRYQITDYHKEELTLGSS